VLLALREQEQAGIDIVTDGEQTRRHFVWGFVEALEGIDFSKMVTIGIRADRYQATVPTVTAPVRRGFGSRLIERSARDQLGGEATVDFLPRGVVYTVTCTLEDGR